VGRPPRRQRRAGLAKTPDGAGALFGATPVRRGYYGKRNSGYAKRYRDLACRIEKAIEAKIPDQWRQDAADHFRVIDVVGPRDGEVEHEQVLSGVGSSASTGSVADPLRAPKSDRAHSVSCEHFRAEVNAWADAAEGRDKARRSCRRGPADPRLASRSHALKTFVLSAKQPMLCSLSRCGVGSGQVRPGDERGELVAELTNDQLRPLT